jgi:hypothetical protein
MILKVMNPRQMNETCAGALNSRNIDNVLALYESDAALKVEGSGKTLTGTDQIAAELGRSCRQDDGCEEQRLR